MKKLRLAVLLSALTLLLCAAAVFPADAANAKPAGHISVSETKLRSGAGTEYHVVCTAKKKAKLTLLSGKVYNDGWYKIKLDSGEKGYVYKEDVAIKKNQFYIPDKLSGYAGYRATIKDIVNTTEETPIWSSSDHEVATVNKNGKLTFVSAGEAIITAKVGDTSYHSALTVINADVTLSETSYTLMNDESFKLGFECKKPVTFSSSDETIAKVDSDGEVVPVADSGKVKIIASSNSGSAECAVTIKKRVITLKSSGTTLYTDCHAILTPSGGKDNTYTYKSGNTSVVSVDGNGLVTAVGSGTANIKCSSGSAYKKIKFKVKKNNYPVDISSGTASVKKGMTYYLKSYNSGVSWSSSDSSIAEVSDGYIKGVKKGIAIISAKTSSGESDCVVKVKAAEPVRFVYTSENSACLNQSVRFYAITDKSRAGVKFEITDPNGDSFTLDNTQMKEKNGRYIWYQNHKLNVAGIYKITAYSHTKSSDKWQTCSGGKAETFVNSTSNHTNVSFDERRATTKLIKIIAGYEGFLSTVTMDPLVSDAPTLGYGRVVYAGSTFYNGLTKEEAYAYLVDTVNNSGFTSRTNYILTTNKIKFNQSHFDALVCFSYNLGAYAIENNSELIGFLKDSYGKSSYKDKAYVNTMGVYLMEEPDPNGTALYYVDPFSTVTLVEKSGSYYKVKYGKFDGYIKAKYLASRSSNTKVRNLKNVKLSNYIKAFLPYHHAGGECYWGLLYRRVDEAEMFFFNEYEINGRGNAYNFSYSCPRYSKFSIGH